MINNVVNPWFLIHCFVDLPMLDLPTLAANDAYSKSVSLRRGVE